MRNFIRGSLCYCPFHSGREGDAFVERWSFTAHPASVGETYAQHLCSACRFSASMISAGIACFVHGLFPFVFVSTGSSTVRKLYGNMIKNRVRVSVDGSNHPGEKPAGMNGA